MIKITFPDGSVREYNEGVTGLQIAESNILVKYKKIIKIYISILLK